MLIFTVPNTLDGQMKIISHDFMDEYNDHNSSGFKRIALEMEEGIKASLVDEMGNDISVKVLNLT